MLLQTGAKYTLEEYFELEKSTDEFRFEYFDGKVIEKSDDSARHSIIQVNLIYCLRSVKKDVWTSSMRIKVPNFPPYRYPDLSVVKNNSVFEKIGGIDVLTNPTIIFEIFSESTADFDRGYKFTYYKSIPSFTEYILIAQDRPHISQFVKQAENSWVNHEFNDINETFYLESLECKLALTEIYENVEFLPIQDRLRIIE